MGWGTFVWAERDTLRAAGKTDVPMFMVSRADFFNTWRLSLAVMHSTSLVHFDSPL